MIKGNSEVIKAARAVPPGNPSSMVCWDQVENLPESLAGHISKVEFTGDDWETTGTGNFMPTPDLVNKICKAAGIVGTDLGKSEAVYEEIDWNRLCCKFDEPPKMVRYHVGYRATKQGTAMDASGMFPPSDQCVVLYNVWERLCADYFSKEETASNYYDPAIVKTHSNGSKYIPKTKKNGEAYSLYLKYGTRAERQKALDDEMKFAQRKSDTKARNLVIRVLTGMATGYPIKDLQGTIKKSGYDYITVPGKIGVLYFSRIEKSDIQIEKEAAARISKISGSIQSTLDEDIFGTPKAIEPPNKPKKTEEVKQPPAPAPTQEPKQEPANEPEPIADRVAGVENTFTPPVVQKKEYLRVLKAYKEADLIKEDLKEGLDVLENWVSKEKDPEKNERFWKRALSRLSEIEAAIPEEMRIKHSVE